MQNAPFATDLSIVIVKPAKLAHSFCLLRPVQILAPMVSMLIPILKIARFVMQDVYYVWTQPILVAHRVQITIIFNLQVQFAVPRVQVVILLNLLRQIIPAIFAMSLVLFVLTQLI
jgi:hypothetical protein